MSEDGPVSELAPAARLFGRLLVRELDARAIAELRREPTCTALAALGVTAPREDELPELARAYFELFLHPRGWLPPVQSLWVAGRYDADCAVAVRALAAAGGCGFGAGARGAPADHLGCILLLWAELVDEHPQLARVLVDGHLAWAGSALCEVARDRGFYGQVARALVAFLPQLGARTS